MTTPARPPPPQAAARQKVLERRRSPRLRTPPPCPHSAAAAPRGLRRAGGEGGPAVRGGGAAGGSARGPRRERPAEVAAATAPPPVERGSGRPRCAKCAGGFGNRRLRQPPPRARCGVIATVTRALGRRPIRWRELIAEAGGQSRPTSIIQFSQWGHALGEQGGSSWQPVA